MVSDAVVARPGGLENGLLAVEVDSDGFLASVFDKRAEREVIAPGERANVLRLHPDHPNEFDAWDVDRHVFRHGDVLEHAEVVRVVEEGPLLGSIRVVRAFGASRIVQEYVLRAGSTRLDIVTEIDWHEDEKLLDATFPVDVRALEAHYEIQFGSVARPTHRNTTWDWARFEVCAHTWADLSEPDYGVALLNDAKYGHEVAGNVMRLTLLRSPRYPDPTADRGRHRFTYALFPHRGDRRDGGVVAEAHALNVPLRTAPVSEPGGDRARQFLHVDHPGVVIAAVKLADDGSGDVIVRAYEAWGQRARARLALDRTLLRARECDLLERSERELAVAGDGVEIHLRPFEILTTRLSVATKEAAP
jgi:alpha-mannosidase